MAFSAVTGAPSVADRGRHLPGPQLVWRQPRRHRRPSPSAATATLWLLRRPRRGLSGRAVSSGRPGGLGLYEPANRDGRARRVLHVVDRNLSRDLLSRGIPSLVLGSRTDRAADLVRGRRARADPRPARRSVRQTLSAV